MKPKIYLCDYVSTGVDKRDRMASCKRHGCDGVQPSWGTDFYIGKTNDTRFDVVECAKSFRLSVDVAHLDYKNGIGNNALYEVGEVCDARIKALEGHIDECVANGIRVGVFHHYNSIGVNAPEFSPIVVESVRRIVEHCEKVGFILAIENLLFDRLPDGIDVILEKIQSPNLQICMDAGHANLFHHDWREFLTKYHERIVCFHLNNNFGYKPDDPDLGHCHNYLDKGTLDYAEFFALLKKLKCKTEYFLLEVAPPARPTAKEFDEFVEHNVRLLRYFLHDCFC